MGNTEFRAFFWNGVKSEFNILRSNKTKLCISTSKLWIQYNTYVFNYFFFKSSSQMSQDLSFTVITKRILREKICSEKVCSHFLGIRFRNFRRILKIGWRSYDWLLDSQIKFHGKSIHGYFFDFALTYAISTPLKSIFGQFFIRTFLRS